GAEDPNRGAEAFGGDGAAGKQTAAPDRSNQRVQLRRLFEQFKRGRTLSGDDQRVIERRDERGAGLLSYGGRDLFTILAVAIVSDYRGAIAPRRRQLGAGSVGRHHDGASRADMPRRERGSLCVIPR